MGRLIDGQELVDSFLTFLPPDTVTNMVALTPRSAVKATADEVQQLIKIMHQHPLMAGKWEHSIEERNASLGVKKEYPSHSEADFALLNAIAIAGVALGVSDDALLDAVMETFMQSGMYRSEKQSAVFNHAAPKAVANATQNRKPIAVVVESQKLPRLGNEDGLINFSNTLPTPRVYVLQDLIVAVKVCVLAGLGGVSKTMLAMQWAVCVALGLPYMGKETLLGAVLFILGEEDSEEIDRRFNAIVKAMNLTAEQIALVQKRIRAFPMNGLDARLTRKQAGALEGTDFTAEVIAASKALEIEAGVPVRLVILDHAGLIHGGEFNSREDVVQTMRQVTFIAQECKAAVLVLAHSPKTAVGKDKADSNDVAGSAAWVDLARAVFVLRTMDDAEGKNLGVEPEVRKNYASLAVVKNNYGPTGDLFWLQRVTVENYGVSILNPVNLVKPILAMKGVAVLQSLIVSKIKSHISLYSKTGFRDKHHGKTGPLKASKNEIDLALDDLLNRGVLILREPLDAERKQFGLHHTTKLVLDVKA
jgi:RecA-family ATPase